MISLQLPKYAMLKYYLLLSVGCSAVFWQKKKIIWYLEYKVWRIYSRLYGKWRNTLGAVSEASVDILILSSAIKMCHHWSTL